MMERTSINLEGIEREHALHLLKQMIRIRRFEERCAELYTEMKIRGFLHLYIGEEAVATGAMQALGPEDSIVATYREHGHALVRGVSARAIMAEMFGKVEGCSRGRGGSMHLFDKATKFYGGSAIVGAALPLAVGLALADKMQNRPNVTACFFGEGAMAEGEFHESMNLAELWRLPVLFLCENNLYAMGTAIERSESQTNLVEKAHSYNTPSSAVDGMNVIAVERAVKDALDTIKKEGQPYFLECRTYRFRPHSMFDPQFYRERSEIEEWKKRDPIELLKVAMREKQWLADEHLTQLENDAAEEINDAVTFAEQAEWEPVEELTRFVYSEPERP